MAALSMNSPFGIAQIQQLIDIEELIDSLLSDSIPFMVKSHYFNLLYEVFLKKVNGLDYDQRLNIQDIKMINMLNYVIKFDLEQSYMYFKGLIITPQPGDPEHKIQNIHKVESLIQKDIETQNEMLNVGKSEAEREEELKNKAMCCSYKDTSDFLIIDPNDKSEFWNYLYKYNTEEQKTYGMLTFVENLY